jgi:hypothetical protein
MKKTKACITLLLSLYFLVFSALPQNYTFMGELLLKIKKELSSDSSIELEDTAEEKQDDKKPPTLVEEDLFHCSDERTAFYMEVDINIYKHFNEDCKGISPAIPLPPPDRA